MKRYRCIRQEKYAKTLTHLVVRKIVCHEFGLRAELLINELENKINVLLLRRQSSGVYEDWGTFNAAVMERKRDHAGWTCIQAW